MTDSRHITKTLPFKAIGAKKLLLDAHYVDSPSTGPQPLILFFHGGFLVIPSTL